ncbi:MAG: bifunctional oligoribonuclease/PAP phosphatase NrnA [Candidatus Moranbacteria bacterium]|nr:bifunctional oligoribonuclease/PAP phosphatase NrnA [Candidatus Moranbacteria bacterium]
MQITDQFYKEFHSLNYVLKKAKNILIIAHSFPDSDATGSAVAFSNFIKNHYQKESTLACFDEFPEFLKPILGDIKFNHPEEINLKKFDIVIGCDSVERGMDRIINKLSDNCITVAIDHHPDINLEVDIKIIDPIYAATCEILYNFFHSLRGKIDKKIATALLTGIVGDTGAFQHSNTSANVLAISSDLVNAGASIAKIIDHSFANKKIDTLKFWGKAIEKTKFFTESGLAVTAITQEDIDTQGSTPESTSDIANILTTIPGIKVAVIISQIKPNIIKGSLRTEKHANVNVSKIAQTLGGGGHKLASGFEMSGKIIISKNGDWQIV